MEQNALAPTRTRKQHVYTSLKKTIWTPEEDDLLCRLMNQTHTNSWSSLVKFFPNKTAAQISGRWGKVLNPCLVKGSWTRDEDEIILNFVKKNGCGDWAKLALLLPKRTGKQCRERFKNHLDSSVSHNPFQKEEDEKLIELHEKYGNKWTMISSYFPGRTDNCLKNRWNSTLKKRIERMKLGKPLVQKRGRKPKPLTIPKPDFEIDTLNNASTDICSSPVIDAEPPNYPTIILSLNFDRIMKKQSFSIPSQTLEQNRNNFEKLLTENQ